ncbi:hypothetical protein IWZ01DRAFT_97599 [Phyllosticta capitalensis]
MLPFLCASWSSFALASFHGFDFSLSGRGHHRSRRRPRYTTSLTGHGCGLLLPYQSNTCCEEVAAASSQAGATAVT